MAIQLTLFHFAVFIIFVNTSLLEPRFWGGIAYRANVAPSLNSISKERAVMKFHKISVLALSTAFVLTAIFAAENFALAGTTVPTTGEGITTTTSSTATPLTDGSTLINQTTHGFWIEDPSAANFPSDKVANCNSTLLLSAEGAPIVFKGICSVSDIDGDIWVAAFSATTPDFSDCNWVMNGGTGKYSGVTGSGQCFPGGPITADGSNFRTSWKGEWVLPEPIE